MALLPWPALPGEPPGTRRVHSVAYVEHVQMLACSFEGTSQVVGFDGSSGERRVQLGGHTGAPPLLRGLEVKYHTKRVKLRLSYRRPTLFFDFPAEQPHETRQAVCRSRGSCQRFQHRVVVEIVGVDRFEL